MTSLDTQLNFVFHWGSFFISIALELSTERIESVNQKVILQFSFGSIILLMLGFFKISNGKIYFLVKTGFASFTFYQGVLRFGGGQWIDVDVTMHIKWTFSKRDRPAHDFKCEIYSNDAMSKVSTGQFFTSIPKPLSFLLLGIS